VICISKKTESLLQMKDLRKLMTGRERVERALNFARPDRVPYVDSFQHAGLIHYYTDRSDRADWTTRDVLGLAGRVADMVQGWGLGPSMPEGSRSTDRHGIVWETRGWYADIVHRPFKNASEYAKVLEAEIKRIHASSPDYPETRQKMFLDDDLLCAGVKEFRTTFKKYFSLLGGTVLMYPDVSPGFDLLYTLGGWELFTDLFIGRPEVLVEFMESCTAMQVRRAHAVADASLSPAVLIACDIAHKEGPLVSPGFMAKEYFPRVKRMVDAYHEHGMKVLYHSEGNLWPMMDDLAATGIDGLNPCEPHSHMDVEVVRAKYPRLVLWGGVDNSYLLVHGTPGDVRRRVERLKEFGRDGGLLIGSTGQVHPACKLENLIAMVETIHGGKLIDEKEECKTGYAE
jgi:hypothetical protein